jgi:hypothetical protein
MNNFHKCSNGCGHSSSEPTKECPPNLFEGLCAVKTNQCSSDDMCRKGKKCCPVRCGRECLSVKNLLQIKFNIKSNFTYNTFLKNLFFREINFIKYGIKKLFFYTQLIS